MTNAGAKQRAKQKAKQRAKQKKATQKEPKQKEPKQSLPFDGVLASALLIHRNQALLVKASLLADLIENEEKTVHTTELKKFAEDALPTLEDPDQIIEVEQCINELRVHLYLLCCKKKRLVAPTLPTYEQACSHSI